MSTRKNPGRRTTATDKPAPPAQNSAPATPKVETPAAAPRPRAGDGRPKCYVGPCELPEFMENVGLCGGHYATRPELRKEARHA